MRVLMVRPNEHPVVMELERGLDAMYKALECDTITATYPWEDPVALVTDDEGLFTEKQPCRYVKDLQQPILGNFFICGLGNEDFADLPDCYVKKYMEMFWHPEMILMTPAGITVIEMDDGTQQEI